MSNETNTTEREISSFQQTLIVDEFDALRREIELQITERSKVENQVLISIAAVYAWVFTLDKCISPVLLNFAILLPVCLACLGFLRWLGIQMQLRMMGNYLAEIEQKFWPGASG